MLAHRIVGKPVIDNNKCINLNTTMHELKQYYVLIINLNILPTIYINGGRT